MAYVTVCQSSELQRGTMQLFRVERKAVLLVWPQDGEIRAFRGRCPHQDTPLEDAHFDGQNVICDRHDWRFDALTGRGVRPTHCELKSYPVEEKDGELRVELKPNAAG